MSNQIFLSGHLQYFIVLFYNWCMKPVFSFPEPTKDTEAILKTILDESDLFQSLDNNMINEILLVFKVADPGFQDRANRINKIKQKLLDIIVDQKDECVNYLILPKFNTISENSKKILKDIITYTWTKFVKLDQEEEVNRKCGRYFCRVDNLKQTEQFHLGLFHFFKSAYFYQNPGYFRMMGGFPPMMAPPAQNNQHFQNFPTVNMPMEPIFPFQITPTQSGNVKIQQDKNSGAQIKYMTEDIQKKKVSKKSEGNTHASKVFMSCVCKGKQKNLQFQPYFQCEECQRKYHLSCLRIPNNSVPRMGVKKICPQCFLKNTNVLYTVIGDPIETFWCQDKQLHKQKITIKLKKCKQIQEKKYSIQIKFTKVQGRTLFDWNQPDSKAGVTEKTKPKQLLHQILIKDQILNKGPGGEDVKISLDCMKGMETRQDDKKPTLLFVALNIVKPKTAQDVMNEKYEYFEENYLDNFMKDKESLKIQIFDIKFKILSIPVRGSDCQHPDVFDLSQFVNHCIDLHSQICFFCSKKCLTFKIDRKIEAEIKKIKASILDQSQYPQAIYYQRDGTFKWTNQGEDQGVKMQVEQNKNQEQIQNEMQNEDMQFASLQMSQMQSEQDQDEDEKKAKGNKKNKMHD